MRISRKRRTPEQENALKKYVANEQIKTANVRVIGENGENLGVMTTLDAIATANSKDLDLVMIDPKTDPPVTKFLNFGQFKYQKEKEDRKKKAQSHTTEVKGIRLTPRIAGHDIEVRIKQARNFLDRGDKVQLEVIMHGRDKAHPDIIAALLKTFIEKLRAEVPIRIEQDIQRQGTKFIALVAKQ